MSRPLLVTADPVLLDELLRLAASASVDVDVAQDAVAVRRCWASASLVVLGSDLVDRCVGSTLARRSRVVLVGFDLDDAGIWQRAVEVGAEHVVFLPDAEGWLVAELAEANEGSAREAPLVAVLSGRGGAGATVLASALALTAIGRDVSTVLIDLDPLGGGIDMVFGGEHTAGLRWPDLEATHGRLPAQALAQALPTLHGLPVLSCGRTEATQLPLPAVRAVLSAARRSSQLVVVDLGRSFDEPSREVLASAATTLLITPAEVRATAAASRVAARAALLCRDVRLVVRGPAPLGLATPDVVRAIGLPLVGELRPEPGLDAALERGEPPTSRGRSPLASLCGTFLDTLTVTHLEPPLRRSA